MDLTREQLQAINYVNRIAQKDCEEARQSISSLLAKYNLNVSVEVIIASIRKNTQVTLNFHPDRLVQNNLTVVDGLLQEGKYQSQFVTGHSNGSRTAFPGGDRDLWEEKLFGGAYQTGGVLDSVRPKYGALNLLNYMDGASPRFGSCYLRLHPHIMNRCTFTFGDSHLDPEVIGTNYCMEPIVAKLLSETERTKHALGINMDVAGLIEFVLEPSFGVIGRALDDYMEAQIHGEISLKTDVDALVADKSFQGTPIGEKLEELCSKYFITLEWHPGFKLDVNAVPEYFRGPAIPPFARRVEKFSTIPGQLDAYTIGKAARTMHENPEIWEDWATLEETFQHFKQLWHVLVKFGKPF